MRFEPVDKWWRKRFRIRRTNRHRPKPRSVYDTSGLSMCFAISFFGAAIFGVMLMVWLDLNTKVFSRYDQWVQRTVQLQYQRQRTLDHWRWMGERQKAGEYPFHGPPTPKEHTK